MEKQVEEAEQLEGWGSHHCHCPPDSWSRWLWRPGHLSQMGRNLLARSSDIPWEAKPKGILADRPSKEAQWVLAWDNCPPQDMVVPKEHRTPDSETPLLMASLQDCHASTTCTSRGALLYACRKLQRHI